MTEEKESKEWVDIPFGPPPKEYSYRCSLCGYRVGINEVIIDTAIGVAKFSGKFFLVLFLQAGNRKTKGWGSCFGGPIHKCKDIYFTIFFAT